MKVADSVVVGYHTGYVAVGVVFFKSELVVP